MGPDEQSEEQAVLRAQRLVENGRGRDKKGKRVLLAYAGLSDAPGLPIDDDTGGVMVFADRGIWTLREKQDSAGVSGTRAELTFIPFKRIARAEIQITGNTHSPNARFGGYRLTIHLAPGASDEVSEVAVSGGDILDAGKTDEDFDALTKAVEEVPGLLAAGKVAVSVTIIPSMTAPF